MYAKNVWIGEVILLYCQRGPTDYRSTWRRKLMSSISVLWKCLFGPPLYRIHDRSYPGGKRPGSLTHTRGSPSMKYNRHERDYSKHPNDFELRNVPLISIPDPGRLLYQPGQTSSRSYIPNGLERNSDSVLYTAKLCQSLCLFLSPVIVIYLYRHAHVLTPENGSKLTLFIVIAVGGSTLVRGMGRYMNRDYTDFARVLIKNWSSEVAKDKRRESLHKYDFGFHAWPVDYVWETEEGGEKLSRYPPKTTPEKPGSMIEKTLAWIVAHTIGRRLLYPGSVGLLQTLMKPALDQGRTTLFEKHNARRLKLESVSGRAVEGMLVDMRGQSENGNWLVITCEGNAGFLEVGCMTTVLNEGYSVLGWNHPGFGGSEGEPWPGQEREAVEVVVQYALKGLDWKPQKIVVYAWSIGGFTATWATFQYPDLGGVVLDATFDDVLPLAKARMPQSWGGLVENVIRKYLDMPIAKQLESYQGPIALIRRSMDEVICTRDSGTPEERLKSNRGNDLLKAIIMYRYPKLFEGKALNMTFPLLEQWLHANESSRTMILATVSDAKVADWATELLRSHVSRHGASYPMMVGEKLEPSERAMLALFLATKYLTDFNSTHCNPLPGHMFTIPKHPHEMLSD